jgi:methionine biosynthesis protein MetW
MASVPGHSTRYIADMRVDGYFPEGDLVVDLGCGDGAWIESVRSRYTRAIGIDIDDAALAVRGGSVEGWEFLHMDLDGSALPLPDGCADGVRANQVIEHVSNPLHFVQEACRVLRPGGVFVATTPNVRYARHILRLLIKGQGPLTSAGALRTSQVWDDGHIHFFTTRDLEWLAHAGGFSRVQTTALISVTGKGAWARRALDRIGSWEVVKGFLTGNIMVVAWK